MVFSTCTFAFATELPQSTLNVSEYDSIQYYASLSEDEMYDLGFSNEEVIDITAYKEDYARKIIMYSQMSQSELERMSFSSTQILTFQSLKDKNINLSSDASEDEINLFLEENATKGLTGSVDMDVFKYGSGSGYNKFRATWSWTGRPIVVGLHDTVAFNWTNGHTLITYDDVDVTLECDSSVSPTYTVPTSDKDTSGADSAVRFRFPTANNGGWLYHTGTCILTLYNDDNSPTTAMSWKYAHGTVKIAGFGISLDGGDLSVNLGSTQMANGLKQFTGLT